MRDTGDSRQRSPLPSRASTLLHFGYAESPVNGLLPFDPIGLRGAFTLALRRTAREVAAHLRTPFVNRAKKLPRARPCVRHPHVQRGATARSARRARLHAHKRAVADEMRHAFRVGAEAFPIVAGDAHVGIQI
jgi:hypothetical protein